MHVGPGMSPCSGFSSQPKYLERVHPGGAPSREKGSQGRQQESPQGPDAEHQGGQWIDTYQETLEEAGRHDGGSEPQGQPCGGHQKGTPEDQSENLLDVRGMAALPAKDATG